MRPSESFTRMLEIMDPLLSVRWGPHVGSWVIERKAVLQPDEVFYLRRRAERLTRKVALANAKQADKDTLAGILEELTAAEANKRVILFTPSLNDRVYNQLCLSDIRRYGGYSRYCDEMERNEEAKEADRERQLMEWKIARSKEAARVIRFLEDKRATQLQHGGRTVAEMLGTKDYLPRELPKHLFDGNGRVAKEL